MSAAVIWVQHPGFAEGGFPLDCSWLPVQQFAVFMFETERKQSIQQVAGKQASSSQTLVASFSCMLPLLAAGSHLAQILLQTSIFQNPQLHHCISPKY